MIIGETLQASDAVYSSEWFPRQGDGLLAACEILVIANSPSLFLGVQTKNREDADSAAATLSSTSFNAEGVYTLGAAGCKELIRFVFIVAGAGGRVHFRMLPTIWFPN